MSSIMVHVLAAYRYKSDADVAFYVGSAAPDVIEDHIRKDHTHFRDRTDRLQALNELANTINWENEFEIGVLFHLFLDYHWDKGPIQDFKDHYKGDNWFLDYRKEIGKIAVWHYHKEPWSNKVWNKMREYTLPVEETICEIRRDELSLFLIKHHSRYIETKPIVAEFFPPEMVDKFIEGVINEFKAWRSAIGR